MGTKLEGKVALVTGGASGIGRASALGLAGEGAAVAVLDRDGPGADETVHLIAAAGGRAVVRTVEVSDTASLGRSLPSTYSAHRLASSSGRPAIEPERSMTRASACGGRSAS